eukprot:COSAG02_NODE_5662_length_4145_cov_2.169056_4_plen_43_part_00
MQMVLQLTWFAPQVSLTLLTNACSRYSEMDFSLSIRPDTERL